MHFQCWSFRHQSQKYGHVPSTHHHSVSCGQLSAFTSGIKQCIFQRYLFVSFCRTYYGHILSDIPTTGTGAVESAPKTIGNKDYSNANLENFVSFLDKTHQVNLVNVWSFKGWYFGGPNSKLAVLANMKIEPLNPNAIGNLGLVNRQNILLDPHSVIFHHLFTNARYRSSYTSFFLDKKMYTYTDVVMGREIVGGLTRLKLMYAVIKPQLAVDHHTTEMLMEALTLSDCNNNVRNYLTKQQENVL